MMKRTDRPAEARLERIWDMQLMMAASGDRIPAAMLNPTTYRTR